MNGKLEILGLGIDLANDFTQVSYISNNMENDPVSVSVIPGEQKYLIPTVLFFDELSGRWHIGDDAIQRAFNSNKGYISNFVKTMLECDDFKGQYFQCGDRKISYQETIYYYLSELFYMVRNLLNCEVIHDVSVAIESPVHEMIDCLYTQLLKIGFVRENIRVIDHAEAFIYYMLNQKRELWINDVALFDYNKDQFIYRKMRTIKNTKPKTISVDEEDYSEVMHYSLLSDESGKNIADRKFFQIIQENFRKSVISSVFLTGSGFYEEWAKESLPELCSKRKVFKGYNLYVKGSTYSAMKRYKNLNDIEYLFDCVGRTKVNINLLIVHDGRNMALSLSKAGKNWYEAGAQTECILDEISRIQVVFEEPISMMSKIYAIELPSFERPNKTTRIRISLAYTDDINCVVKIEDLGFGEFFKSTGFSVTKEINIEDLF
ncbi:MAG: hypothetical protein E7266_00855 [Lachnospiraceae bacterium]|nr:hypothetical protein [Lachnospiraceae bacterium]